MLAWGPSWAWVIAANVLLGINQGLTWSMTVNMKIDLIGPGRRGFALGINETAGYLGVAVTALATGYLATGFGLRPAPNCSASATPPPGWPCRRSRSATPPPGPAPKPASTPRRPGRARRSARSPGGSPGPTAPWRRSARPGWSTTSTTAWSGSMLPVLLVSTASRSPASATIKALYPFMWAAGMIATGHLADRIGRKPPIVAGMLIQAAGLAVITAGISHALAAGLAGAFLLGVGTSLVYPTLLAAVSDATHPAWRASALGVYRFWRDAGYAIGALIGGVTAALASLDAAIGVAAVLTAASGLLAWAFMKETHPRPAADGG